jgi:molybdenum cofactor cytidylyltransferase
MGLAGVILAAGESTRMGRDKALLPWPPTTSNASAGTLLSNTVVSLSRICDLVIVVTGNNETALAPVIYATGAFLARNPSPERGQFSSLQTGLRETLNHGRDSAIVTLVDRPAPAATTLEQLVTAFDAKDRGTWLVVPEYESKHGHPIVVGREMIEEFLKAPLTATARDIEHANQAHIKYWPVDDRFVITNINTPEDYASLQSHL